MVELEGGAGKFMKLWRDELRKLGSYLYGCAAPPAVVCSSRSLSEKLNYLFIYFGSSTFFG